MAGIDYTTLIPNNVNLHENRRLQRALEEFVLEGMKTTAPLHRRIIRDPEFLSGDYTIKWLEKWLEKNPA